MNIKFSYVDRWNRREIFEVHISLAKTTAIALLERSQMEDLGPLFILKGQDWHEVDYYNLGIIL